MAARETENDRETVPGKMAKIIYREDRLLVVSGALMGSVQLRSRLERFLVLAGWKRAPVGGDRST